MSWAAGATGMADKRLAGVPVSSSARSSCWWVVTATAATASVIEKSVGMGSQIAKERPDRVCEAVSKVEERREMLDVHSEE